MRLTDNKCYRKLKRDIPGPIAAKDLKNNQIEAALQASYLHSYGNA